MMTKQTKATELNDTDLDNVQGGSTDEQLTLTKVGKEKSVKDVNTSASSLAEKLRDGFASAGGLGTTR